MVRSQPPPCRGEHPAIPSGADDAIAGRRAEPRPGACSVAGGRPRSYGREEARPRPGHEGPAPARHPYPRWGRGRLRGSEEGPALEELRTRLVHGGEAGDVEFEAEDESLGTLVWFGLAGPVVEALADGAVFLADELDASLHPALVAELVRLFQGRARPTTELSWSSTPTTPRSWATRPASGPSGVTRFWFTEKRGDGSTRLYPLVDLDPRKEEAIGRRYLGGRYGATYPVPPGVRRGCRADHLRRPRVSPGSKGPPRRRVSHASVRRELLVFVEGLRTEEMYLVYWHRRFRDRVSVTIDRYRATPLPLVEHAFTAKKAEARDARRGGGRAHDQIWCVFDRDEHPNVPQAIDLAARQGINVAFSNPCLELWFLLHFQDQTAYLERKVAQACAEALLDCSKALSPGALEALAERVDDAKVRARLLDDKHAGDGSPAGSNPSSNVWEIVDQIRQA